MDITHSIIHIFRQDGCSQQEAYEKANILLQHCYRAWYIAQAEVPLWGEKIDSVVQQYLKGCQDLVLANLHWRLGLDLLLIGHHDEVTNCHISFHTERYFGKYRGVARETRRVKVVM